MKKTKRSVVWLVLFLHYFMGNAAGGVILCVGENGRVGVEIPQVGICDTLLNGCDQSISPIPLIPEIGSRLGERDHCVDIPISIGDIGPSIISGKNPATIANVFV